MTGAYKHRHCHGRSVTLRPVTVTAPQLPPDEVEIAETLQDRAARAAQWRQDQAERAAICAGLDWQDCIRALVKAKRMSPGTAEMMGVAL